MSMIHGAASKGLAEAVQKALDEGADVNGPDGQGLTPLMTAAVMGQPGAMPVLLEAGAEVDRQLHNGFTALMFAAVSGKTEAVQALLDGGSSVDLATYSGETALWFAADKGNGAVVAQLAAAGASTAVQSSKGSQPLHLCAFASDGVGCAALVDAGADVHAEMGDGTDPLMCAAQEGARMVVELLLAKGADPTRPNRGGATALMLAAMRGQTGVCERLLAAGAPVDARTQNGESAAYLAAQGDHLELLQQLAAAGADLHGPFVQGEGCLHAACSNATNRSVGWLLEQGCDPHAVRPDGVTPLLLVGAVGTADAARQLLAKGADVNHAMANGMSPLHAACDRGARELAEVLVAAGADPHMPGFAGRSPIDSALARGHTELAQALQGGGPVQAKAPEALLADLREGKRYAEGLAWVKNQGTADPRVLQAVLDGISAHRPDFSVSNVIEDLLLNWSHRPDGRDPVLEGLSDQAESALAANHWQDAVERINRLKSVVSRGFRVVDPETGRKRYLAHAGACTAHVPRWSAWLDVLIDLGPSSGGSKYFRSDSAASGVVYLLNEAKTGDAAVYRQCLDAVVRFPGEKFSTGLGLVSRLGAEEVSRVLLPVLFDAAVRIDPEKLEPGASYPAGNPGYAQVQLLVEHLLPAELTAEAFAAFVEHPGRQLLARWLPVEAGQSEYTAKRIAESAFIQALLPWLHQHLDADPSLERFAALGVRLGLLPDSALYNELLTLPEALPQDWDALRALWNLLGLQLDQLEGDGYFGEMLAMAMATVLEEPEPGFERFHSEGWATDLEEWVEIHESRVDPDYVVQKYWRDARPHLPVSQLVVMGRASTTDYYFIDPKVRTAADRVPVMLYLHEIPLGCEVAGPSLPEFLGHHIAQVWAKREGAMGQVAHLTLPSRKDVPIVRRVE